MLISKKIKILPLIIFIGLSGILSSCSQKKILVLMEKNMPFL